MNPIFVNAIGSGVAGIVGFCIGVLWMAHRPAKRALSGTRDRQRRIQELDILDAKPGDALECPGCTHPVSTHTPDGYEPHGCRDLYCRCTLTREEAGQAAKNAIAGELNVLRYGPSVDLEPSLLDLQRKLNKGAS